ncbi:MAG: hypothetical protein AMXMBFR64_05040 [Myxococcales bacterium]
MPLAFTTSDALQTGIRAYQGAVAEEAPQQDYTNFVNVLLDPAAALRFVAVRPVGLPISWDGEADIFADGDNETIQVSHVNNLVLARFILGTKIAEPDAEAQGLDAVASVARQHARRGQQLINRLAWMAAFGGFWLTVDDGNGGTCAAYSAGHTYPGGTQSNLLTSVLSPAGVVAALLRRRNWRDGAGVPLQLAEKDLVLLHDTKNTEVANMVCRARTMDVGYSGAHPSAIGGTSGENRNQPNRVAELGITPLSYPIASLTINEAAGDDDDWILTRRGGINLDPDRSGQIVANISKPPTVVFNGIEDSSKNDDLSIHVISRLDIAIGLISPTNEVTIGSNVP